MVIRTDVDQAGLAAFIMGQLERSGWARTEGGDDGALTWSTWSFTDGAGQTYCGILHVLRCPERVGQYRLTLVAEWVSPR